MRKILILLLTFPAMMSLMGQADSTYNNWAVKDTQDVKSTLFDSDDLFEITLKFDISYYKRKKSDTEYLDAYLTYFSGGIDSVTKKVRIRARGNIRRTAVCDFPPMMLNFKMKDSVGAEFAGINKLKIVPYCRIGYERYVLKEYLAYKLFNILTDYSFRVRLFKINYVNTSKPTKPVTQYGFAIEPVKLLEKRTMTLEVDFSGTTQRGLNADMLDRMAVFNYMIGNTDWSVPIRHNVVLLSPASPGILPLEKLIVPYDFDYSGLVNASYAAPFETLPIKTIRERLYMAVCRSEERFGEVLSEFAGKKEELYRVINEFQYTSAGTKKEMIKYLDEFFSGINRKNYLVRRLENDCLWFESQSNLRVR